MREKAPISRVSLACLACRSKKTRCGGQKPVCDNCARASLECSYDPRTDQRKPYSKAYVSTLQARINSLEKELERNAREQRRPPQSRASKSLRSTANPEEAAAGHAEDGEVPASGSSRGMLRAADSALSATAAAAPLFSSSSSSSSSPAPASTSALHDTELVGQLARRGGNLLRHRDAGAAAEGTFRFYGASSGRNFQLAHCHKPFRFSRIARASRRRLSALGLPLDLETAQPAQELYADYFERANPILMLLDEATFRRHLALDTEQATHASCFLLNAVCAVGAFVGPRRAEQQDEMIAETQRMQLCETHLERARALIDVEDEFPQLTTIQGLVLLGYCEAARGRESRGWLYTGMAARIALELGIPRDSHEYVEAGWMTIEDLVARHRTLFALYTLENLLSLFHGRPPCLDASVISATAPSFRNLPPKALSTPCPVARNRGAACHSCRGFDADGYYASMFELTNYSVEIFDRLYVNPILKGGDASARWTGWASDLNLRLAQWNADLPRALKCSLTRGQIPAPRAMFLQLVYHALVILLNRPFLALGANMLEAAFSAKACHVASRAIAVLAAELDARHGPRLAHNYVVFVVHTAITVSLLNAKSSTGTVRREARNDLHSLVATLRSLSLVHLNAVSVLRLVTALVRRTFSEETAFAESVCDATLTSNKRDSRRQSRATSNGHGSVESAGEGQMMPLSGSSAAGQGHYSGHGATAAPIPTHNGAVLQGDLSFSDADLSHFAFVDWDSHEALGFGDNIIAGIDIQPWLGPSAT